MTTTTNRYDITYQLLKSIADAYSALDRAWPGEYHEAFVEAEINCAEFAYEHEALITWRTDDD